MRTPTVLLTALVSLVSSVSVYAEPAFANGGGLVRIDGLSGRIISIKNTNEGLNCRHYLSPYGKVQVISNHTIEVQLRTNDPAQPLKLTFRPTPVHYDDYQGHYPINDELVRKICRSDEGNRMRAEGQALLYTLFSIKNDDIQDQVSGGESDVRRCYREVMDVTYDAKGIVKTKKVVQLSASC